MNRSGHKKYVLFEYFTKSEALGCIYGIFKHSADVSQSSSALLIHRGSGGSVNVHRAKVKCVFL